MRFRIATLVIIGVWSVVMLHSTLRAQRPSAQIPRSVLDRVYTDEQATRGAAIYVQECVSCHGPTLDGIDDMGPPLRGMLFMENWTGLTVGDVFEKIRVSMPASDPGKLSRQEYADIVAYVLRSNKFPAGKTDLALETEALKQIRLMAPKP